MCGIICGQGIVRGELINRAVYKLKHRGPDSANIVSFDNIFLGHTRLSIVDIATGQQPLISEDGTVFACVNGEFYDHLPLRNQLISKGYQFKTNSDSEILIALYQEYGINCLAFLHGEFAFVLFDKKLQQWFCARDRMGIRPLQYYLKEGLFFVASEAKALFELGVPAKLNKENFWFSQHLQYLPQNGTLFQNIHSIKPAHFILVKEGKIKEVSYWSLNNIQTQPMLYQEALEGSRDLIEKAVARRIPNEVKWTCHLSGGIDSGIVSALAQNYTSNGSCFTVKFIDDGFYDETALAKETAQFIGANLIEVPVSFGDMLNVMPEAIYHAEGLSINGHLGAKYLLNKAIKEQGYKVAMSGEGSDEIFMGYSHLKQDYLTSHSLNNMEKQYLNGVQLPDGQTLDLSSIKNSWGFVPTWLAAKSSMAYKFKSLWHPNFTSSLNPYQGLVEEFQFSKNQSPLKVSSQSWMKYCLSGYILKVLDDAQAMAHGIEGRLPFLDTQLVEFMWSVPDEHFFHQGIEKGLLRLGFKNYLPAAVINKTKQSFMSPPIHWALKNPVYSEFISHYLLDNPAFLQQNLFNPAKVAEFLNQAKKESNPSMEPILMTLLSTSIFCERFKL